MIGYLALILSPSVAFVLWTIWRNSGHDQTSSYAVAHVPDGHGVTLDAAGGSVTGFSNSEAA